MPPTQLAPTDQFPVLGLTHVCADDWVAVAASIAAAERAASDTLVRRLDERYRRFIEVLRKKDMNCFKAPLELRCCRNTWPMRPVRTLPVLRTSRVASFASSDSAVRGSANCGGSRHAFRDIPPTAATGGCAAWQIPIHARRRCRRAVAANKIRPAAPAADGSGTALKFPFRRVGWT